MKKSARRGQITIFIIIGIILLFAVGFVIYIATIYPGLNFVTPKETPLGTYIGACLASVTKDAIVQLGTQGGYIQIPKQVSINDRAYYSFAPGVDPKIPLWYYRGNPTYPYIDTMQDQISQYVLGNIDSCLGNFTSFRDQFNLQLKGNATVNTTITNSNVITILNYPLQVTDKQTGSITDVTSVSRTLDVKLGEMWNMAIDILKSENEQLYFENLTMDVLSSSTSFPLNGMDFSCSPKIWKKSDIITFSKTALSSDINLVTVKGNPFTFFDTTDAYSRNHLVFPLSQTYPDLGAAFQYTPDARFELHVNPNDAQILTSNVGQSNSPLLSFFCINQYHFTYDIEYPILATLRDDTAFGGKGFLFNFAFPVTINHNQGDKKDFPIVQFSAPEFNYGFCNDTSPQSVTIHAKDVYTYQSLYQANITFQCVHILCDLGATNADSGFYELQTNIPVGCTNGEIIANADGYLQGQTVYRGESNVDVDLTPARKFSVNVTVHDSTDFSRVSQIQPLESVVMTITSLNHPELTQQIYDSDNPADIQLVDGDGSYQVEAIFIQYDDASETTSRIIGGYVGQWNVTYPELALASQLNLNVVQKLPIAVTDAEQQDTALYLYQDTSYQKALRPTFS